VTVKIYHDPDCGTSRDTLAMICKVGEEPIVIEYLKNPPSRDKLEELIKAMRIPVRSPPRKRDALRGVGAFGR
jgi:arsenate reductase